MSVTGVLKNPEVLEVPQLQRESRPRFGKRQIRCQNQISKEQAIRICNNKGNEEVFIVARSPYRECGKLKIDLKFWKNGRNWNRTILLEDYSVVRHDKDASWETTNWLEKA